MNHTAKNLLQGILVLSLKKDKVVLLPLETAYLIGKESEDPAVMNAVNMNYVSLTEAEAELPDKALIALRKRRSKEITDAIKEMIKTRKGDRR